MTKKEVEKTLGQLLQSTTADDCFVFFCVFCVISVTSVFLFLHFQM